MAIPALNPLWRTSPVDDREQVRLYSGAPATEVNVYTLTNALNLLAAASPAAVQTIQSSIDEILELEDIWRTKLADSQAHLANAQEFDGVLPGTPLTRDDMLEQADVVRWNVGLLRTSYKTGGAANSEGAVLSARIEELKQRVLSAVGFQSYGSGGRLIRS